MGDTPFTQQDEQIFASYLQFCGIGLRNAHLYEKSQLEVKRNQVLLDLARMIFEEQSTIEHVVFRILTHTQSLIQCQRVQVSDCSNLLFPPPFIIQNSHKSHATIDRCRCFRPELSHLSTNLICFCFPNNKVSNRIWLTFPFCPHHYSRHW